MALLLDTHAFLWWLGGDPKLTARAREAIGRQRSEVYVSAASAWEITTKHRIGKLPGAAVVAEDVGGVVRSQGFGEVAVTLADGALAGRLEDAHRDPFDRMLVAQARLRDWAVVTNEEVFGRLGARRLW